MRRSIQGFLALALVSLLTHTASAVPVEIDRTRRTVDIPAECLNVPPPLNFNGGGLILNNVNTRFTFVLSTTPRLLQRVNQGLIAGELSWFHFVPGDPNSNAGLNDEQRLRRAAVLLRCGLPAAQGDSNLYQYPADPNVQANFLRFAMGQGGNEPRVATGYTLVGNGEREAILMYAAQQIKMDLTPTLIGQNLVCVKYAHLENASSCLQSRAPAAPLDPVIGYLYEGMQRISYTGHEFWLMYSNPIFRAKVYFTSGTVLANGTNVDNFVAWNLGPAFWNDAGGNRTTLAPAPYRFQNLVDVNNNRAFYQNLMPAFQAQYDQHVLIYRQW